MTNYVKIAAFVAALVTGSMVECLAADPPPIVVEIESPLASPHPLQGYLRQANGAGPSPAVVLRLTLNTQSVSDALRSGTRTAWPLSLPSNSG